MGSLKKKKATKKNRVIDTYRKLSLLDRIAMKKWLWFFGRNRYRLIDVIYKEYSEARVMEWVWCGYGISHWDKQPL